MLACMLCYFLAPDSAVAAGAMPFRVARLTIKDTTFETIDPTTTDHGTVLSAVLNLCVAPAEQRFQTHSVSGKGGNISAALAMIDVRFPSSKPANAPLLGPLATDYPALERSLCALTIAHNAYDESTALGAFAALATRLQELTFEGCGLASLRGLEGRCEYLRKVDFRSCKQLSDIDALADRVSLETVDVSRTDIASIEPLRSCPNLTKVGLSRCPQLSSIDALAVHQRLQQVRASYTDITSIEPLRSCPKLTTVDLFACWKLPAKVRLADSVRVFR